MKESTPFKESLNKMAKYLCFQQLSTEKIQKDGWKLNIYCLNDV